MPKSKYKKRKDGRYEAKITVGKDDMGKYVRVPIYARTVPELEEKIREAKNLADQGVDLTANIPTLKAWAERWLNVYKRPSVKRSQIEVYESHINKWLLPLHHIKINAIKQIQLQEILAKAAGELSQSSVDKLYNCICGIFKSAKANGLLPQDVTEQLDKPTGLRRTKRTALTDAEVTALTKACQKHQQGLLPMLQMYCGLRINEALALTWGDIGDKLLRVNKTIVYEVNSNTPTIKESPKTVAGVREVPIPGQVKQMLNRPQNVLDSAFVFGRLYSKTAKRILWASLMRAYRAEFKKEGNLAIEPMEITSHMLRHTYATILYDAGIDVKTAQRWLGHATIAMTLDVYTHLSKAKETESIDKLKAYFSDDNSDDNDDKMTTQKPSKSG